MAQTTYSRSFGGAYSGQPGDDVLGSRVESFVNGEGSDIPAGIAVCQKGTTEGSVELIDAAADVPVGVVLNSYARDPNSLSNADAVKDGNMANVLTEGAVFVKVEDTLDVSDDVFVRHTANGAGKLQLGAFRSDSDSGNASQVFGARWLKGASAGGVALLYFSAAAHRAAFEAGDAATTAQALQDHLDDAADAHDASAISLADAANLLAAAEVEAAIAELAKYECIEVADPGGANAAIPVTRSASLGIVTAGAETNTLAIPTFLGQKLFLYMDTRVGGDRVVTSAQALNQTGNTIMTFGAARDNILLQAIKVGSALRWQVVANDGVALSGP